MQKRQNITGFVLAGGRSRRMGQNKAFLVFRGKRLIDYSLSLINQITDNAAISANSNEYGEFNMPVITDNYKNAGPIGGLESCLRWSATSGNIFMPCDTPFLTVDIWNQILQFANDFEAVVPVLEGSKTEPLIGYYSKELLPIIVSQIEKEDFKVLNLLKQVHTKFLTFPDSDAFRNINAPIDMGDSKNSKI